MGRYVKRTYLKTCVLCQVEFWCKRIDRTYCVKCRQVRLNTLRRKRRAENPEKYRSKDREYNHRDNGAAMKTIKNNTRARQYGCSVLSVEVIRSVFVRDNYTCSYCCCRGGTLTVDHVQPLCRQGSNDEMNLVTACRSCNMSKGKKTLVEFMIYISQERN